MAAGASFALAASLPLLGVSAAHATDDSFEPSDASGLSAAQLFESGHYIIQLKEDPVATYGGGVSTFSATAETEGSVDFTSPQAMAYANHLEAEQQATAADVGAQVDGHYTAAFNGFAAHLTSDQAMELLRDRRVANITPNEILQIQSAPATDYLELEAHFEQIGGWQDAGEGIVVGVLDTGIAPENPFFAGEPLGNAAGSDPYLVGSEIHFDKLDGGEFIGECETGEQFTADMCNTKLIGARYFVDGFASSRPIGTPDTGEYESPRDGNGHGSHTASTAAGNFEVPITSMGGVDLGTMSGVAPAAKISSYKVCWEGPDRDVTTDDGCATSDLLAGINAAVEDGVDVINFSIGGGAATTVWDPIDQAFLSAAAAGIFVSASAGNSGPSPVTADHAAPWYATVAAATVPNFEGRILGVGDAPINGASTTVQGGNTVAAELVYAGDIALEGEDAAEAALCFPGTLDADLAAGKIVLCDRGETARVDKSEQAADAGAVGSILVNVNEGESLDLDDHVIPTVHVGAEHRDALLAAAASGETVVTLEEAESTALAPQVAGFSSRGPMLADGSDVIKPDVTAPGVGIIAAGTNAVDTAPTFVFMSGTSMSAPHVAGLAAAYLGQNPNASPAEVKSVISTSAIDTLNANGDAITDAFTQGTGMTQADGMLNAGFYFEAGIDDYLRYVIGTGNLEEGFAGLEGIDPSDLNLHSIGVGALMHTQTVTRTATALAAGTYTVQVQAPAGIDVVVEPSTLTFGAAGEEQEYTVTFTNNGAEIDAWAQGRLVWTAGDIQVRQPLAVRPLSIEARTERIDSERTWDGQPLEISAAYDGILEGTEQGLTPLTAVWDGAPSPEGTDSTSWYFDPSNGLTLEHMFEVQEGDSLLALTTSSTDENSDYDLVLWELVTIGGQLYINNEIVSGVEGSDEVIEVVDPTPTLYLAFTYDYNDPEGEVMSPVKLSVGIVNDEPGVGDLTVSLQSEAGAEDASTDAFNEPVTRGEYEAQVSWQGLEPGQEYYGLITTTLAGASDQTIVRVTPTEETPEPALAPVGDQTVEEGSSIEPITPALDDETGAAEITVEGLPEGVVFEDGVIQGAPVAAGTYEVTVTAVHELGFESVVTFTIVAEPVATEEPSPSAPAPSDSADPQPTEIPGDVDGSLPTTGAAPEIALLAIAALIALMGAGFIVARRRRA